VKITGGWQANSGARWNLSSNAFRKVGFTSADAAGLPVLPGLVRFDELNTAGEIKHAIRMTAPNTLNQFIWPATHKASSLEDVNLPPMGARFRLKSSVNINGYPLNIRIILRALQQYGAVIADNGSPWFLTGVPDENWDNTQLNNEFKKLMAWENMEAVDVSSLIIREDSGQVRTSLNGATPDPPADTPATINPEQNNANAIIAGAVVSGFAFALVGTILIRKSYIKSKRIHDELATWTDAEITALREKYIVTHDFNELCSVVPHRSRESVAAKAKSFQSKTNSRIFWTRISNGLIPSERFAFVSRRLPMQFRRPSMARAQEQKATPFSSSECLNPLYNNSVRTNVSY
jgi:hypothetical protein